jgi:hypothetical protein
VCNTSDSETEGTRFQYTLHTPLLINFRKKPHQPEFPPEIVEELQDMDGNETITIRNPVYDSMYAHQTIA